MHICRYQKPSKVECGYNILLGQDFIGSAKIELQHLVSTKDLLVSYLDKDN
ncbi:hypothetical protein SP40_2 [Salmonella phage 40]|nr:hypothetical protein SP40_2 [Salmonella phage 40]